jgi:peptidyl-prolyl cis-trans isomerase D
MTLSDASINEKIKDMPSFQDASGKFSSEIFKANLVSNNLAANDFRAIILKNFAVTQLRNAVLQSYFTVQPSVDYALELRQQRRSFAYADINTALIKKKISITQDQISKYYTDNKSKFMNSAQVDIEYVVLDKQQLRESIVIEDSAIKETYAKEAKELKSTGDKRDVAHILITLDDDTSPEQALKLAQTVKAELDKGKKFTAAVKQYSQDIATVDTDGSLGEISPGTLPAPIDAALEKMKKGDISEPVLTDFGYHILQLIEYKPAIVETFAVAKKRIVKQMQDSLLQDKFADMRDELADISYSADDLAQVSTTMELKIHTTGLFKRIQPVTPFTDSKLLQEAFSSELRNDGNNSDLIEVGDKAYVLHVKQYQKQKQQTLKQAQAKVKETLLTNKAKEKSRDLANKIQQAFKKIKKINKLALQKVADKIYPGLTTGMKKDTSVDDADAKVKKVFTLPKNKAGDKITAIVSEGNNISVVLLIAVSQVPAKEEDVATINQQLQQDNRQSFVDYSKSLSDKATVKKL